jgi:hypothetical protein
LTPPKGDAILCVGNFTVSQWVSGRKLPFGLPDPQSVYRFLEQKES